MNAERRFGGLIGGVLAGAGLWPLLFGDPPRLTLLAPATLILLAAVFLPRSLTLLRTWWLVLGALIERFTSPITLRVLYYGVLVPFALFHRRTAPGATSEWADASPDDSLHRPF